MRDILTTLARVKNICFYEFTQGLMWWMMRTRELFETTLYSSMYSIHFNVLMSSRAISLDFSLP